MREWVACLIPRTVSKSGNSATCCTVSMGGWVVRSQRKPVIGRWPPGVERGAWSMSVVVLAAACTHAF
jgi:hypothetical protein